ncbi:MAG: spore germination protein GerW family protein [Christensenellaceae bacterium]
MAIRKKLDTMIGQSIHEVADLIDVNTIVGKPIRTPGGIHLIPITKVSMGFLSGGGEYGENKVLSEEKEVPFAGGAGAVVNLKPCAFLVDDGKECKLLRVSDDAIDELIGKASDLLGKFTNA